MSKLLKTPLNVLVKIICADCISKLNAALLKKEVPVLCPECAKKVNELPEV